MWPNEPILCHCTYIDAITINLETLNFSLTAVWGKVRNEIYVVTSQPAQYNSDYTHYTRDEEVAASTRGDKFDVILTKMPTRCNRGFYCRSYCLRNMFRTPLYSSSGAQEYYTVVAACGISCCGFQVAGLVWT